jgi:integrase/recombinase XerD
MNLRQLIDQYVEFRQSLGERFRIQAVLLRAFARRVGLTADVTDVTAEQVRAFLAGTGPLTRAWHNRHQALLGLYRYAVSRSYVTSVPLPTFIPKRPPDFVPHIYTREELQRLLQATDSYQRLRNCLEPVTVRTIILLLYATGLRIREALSLNRADVDLDNSLMTVRQTKFFKSRLVPFGTAARQVLIDYVTRPQIHRPARSGQTPFFHQRDGSRVIQSTFTDSFRRLCEHANVRRQDGARYQPRLHDLRHTFAVHRLIAWYRQGADVQRLLPQLSVYLGHVNLAGTQVYLTMTPELLQEAGTRFERYAAQEPHHA